MVIKPHEEAYIVDKKKRVLCASTINQGEKVTNLFNIAPPKDSPSLNYGRHCDLENGYWFILVEDERLVVSSTNSEYSFLVSPFTQSS